MLYISTYVKRFYNHLGTLSKFPLVRDLIVDRSILFENLKKLNLWLESEAYMNPWTHEPRYQSARCLMCGCCLEVCPNFSANGTFAGAVAAVNAFRILNEEQESTHLNEISAEYKKKYFEGCGKSYLVMIFVRLVCLWKNCL